MRKNRILLFICACIPGCGQMYQGYMKRGISMAAAVCLDIGAASFLNFGELAIVLPVLWLYAFFDTWNCIPENSKYGVEASITCPASDGSRSVTERDPLEVQETISDLLPGFLWT